MLSVTAYTVLIFIINILIGIVISLGIIQQGKSSFGISSVIAWVVFVISLVFFISGGFTEFFAKLGLSLSPILYLVLAIYSMLQIKNLSNLNIRQAMRNGIMFSLIFILFLIIDVFWVKNAVNISLISIGWSYVITLIYAYKNRNIE
ncbi:hypothetical protein SU69_08775 [Thermosipho melanesiensis]|uniref:Uncharacterized protein n=2 Tax=Thermosipho melanesiensis TaxID=46541 RepID=A6LNS5_THEM4|nr:hypothetical protein [Thermosipho melanesiensis]ABR31576.1 hypothetical protein Tmel_1737 [Thermosipho melanesiensis BI429]APT74609.1 hypothetical protein BW47_09150 [Thermosipho melanesiensis]OOC35312.1 hypothetical protein SU69_08775 [Thermosipho melanesiensis]OOC35566.1 hypothetical protein SU70_08785 [Thermosipho melanesiensis]OOC36567.1 hypothetical protein SU68_08840 [Thermosipho melanesiensis]